MLSYGICFSLSDLLHSVGQTLGLSTSLQITQFHFFYGQYYMGILYGKYSISHIIFHMWQVFFIHSSVDGHLGCFHVLAIVNSAAMNIVVHDSLKYGFLRVYAQ